MDNHLSRQALVLFPDNEFLAYPSPRQNKNSRDMGGSFCFEESRVNFSAAYRYGHDLLAEEGTAWAWHLDDGRGSVRQLVDGSGDVTLAQGYTPIGVLLWSEGSSASVYGFTGEQENSYTSWFSCGRDTTTPIFTWPAVCPGRQKAQKGPRC